MMRHAGRVLIVLVLVVLVSVLPAQAARGVQQGVPAPEDGGGAQADRSPASSPAVSAEPAENVPAAGSGRGEPLQSADPAGSGMTATGPSRDPAPAGGAGVQGDPVSQGIPDSPDRQAQGTGAGSGAPGGSGASPAVTGEHAAADTSGTMAGRGSAGGSAAATKGFAGSTGPAEGSGGNPAAGAPETREPAGMTGLPGGTAVARVAAVGGTRADPGPAAGHGPLPPWHNQRRPAAESAGFPCGPAQPAPLPAASGQAKDEAKDPGLPRQRSRRAGDLPEVPGTAAPEPASLPVPPHAFFPFNLLLAGGFRRISRKNVLDHEARQVICRTIAAMPGTSLKTLGGMTGINENTLRYHLDRLLATGKIASFVRPGIVRYFMNQGTYTQFEYRVFHCLWTVTPSGILRLLHQNPGMTRQELAGALMIAGPSVTRQMENLIDDGIVENRSPGRSNHYYLTAEAARALEKVMGQARPVVPSVAEAALFPVPAG